jgi:glycosyltransferase involved in cell wall biosynthesis
MKTLFPAIVCVTNDLTTDQRVDRTCQTLISLGYPVLLVGRRRKHSRSLLPRAYRMDRLRMIFEKGPGFYAEYNIRLFLYLLFRRASIIVSNDLDTLPACFLACRIKNLALPSLPSKKRGLGVGHIHDCHEYFRGVPELVGRERVRRIWKWFEDSIFPSLPMVIAVNESVARLYHQEYGNEITVIRNVPFRKAPVKPWPKQKSGIREDQKVILYQGAVNLDRGLEEAILSMKFLRSDAVLFIAGTGDLFHRLQELVEQQGLTGKVVFTGEIPFQELHPVTCMATIGLSIEKDSGINYPAALPNKFFDYIQARVPVLVSPFHEMKSIIDRYKIGEIIGNHNPEHLAEKIDGMLMDEELLALYRQNLAAAAAEFCWENEAPKLKAMIQKIQ